MEGIRDHQAIFWSVFDGTNWAPQREIRGIGTSHSPTLARLGNHLHMFWKGIRNDSALYHSSLDVSSGSGIWRPQEKVRFIDSQASGMVWAYPGTTHGPAATVVGNRILLTWKGVANDQGIYCSFYDGTDFTGQIRVPNVGTTEGPGILAFGGVVHMAWKGIVNDSTIYWLRF